jgi:hypothetical protein
VLAAGGRTGRTVDRVQVRPPSATTLEVADRADARARLLGQLLLGQAGRPAELTQPRSERCDVVNQCGPSRIWVVTMANRTRRERPQAGWPAWPRVRSASRTNSNSTR